MIRYRVYIENTNRKELIDIVSCYFEGYTVFSADGIWNGQVEKSACIEILTETEKKDKIKRLCSLLRRYFNDVKMIILLFKQHDKANDERRPRKKTR